MSAISFTNCTEELLKLTLQCRLDQTLDFDTGLSDGFCSGLLTSDAGDHLPADSLEGVPPYPLYKRLAYALQQCMKSGTFYKTHCEMPMVGVECSLSHKENLWQELISEKGSEIDNMLKNVDVELHVQEPYFSQMKGGLKTIEGRCAVGKYSRISSGCLILFNKCLLFEVQDVHWYASFSAMLEAESLANVLPGVKSIEEGDYIDVVELIGHSKDQLKTSFVQIYRSAVFLISVSSGVETYRKFYTEEKEKSNGVLAIRISKVAPQPYIYLGLTYRGIQSLLGLANTKGTTEDALPPPRSALLSSFLLPYKINVKGCTLTHGSRALAKHVHRSSKKYWGTLDGSDSSKNSLALDVITHLLAKCCWLNLHFVPPHGDIFEIRDADGYGARWSKDGSKFIGFLEPYAEDGHSAGWKH